MNTTKTQPKTASAEPESAQHTEAARLLSETARDLPDGGIGITHEAYIAIRDTLVSIPRITAQRDELLAAAKAEVCGFQRKLRAAIAKAKGSDQQ